MIIGLLLLAGVLTLLILIEINTISLTRWIPIGILCWIFLGTLINVVKMLFR